MFIYLQQQSNKNMSEHTKNTPVTKEWLTIKDVMDRLKISRTKLHELRTEGKLTAYTEGGIVRYKLEDVEGVLTPAK
jgi:hypothetical protein